MKKNSHISVVDKVTLQIRLFLYTLKRRKKTYFLSQLWCNLPWSWSSLIRMRIEVWPADVPLWTALIQPANNSLTNMFLAFCVSSAQIKKILVQTKFWKFYVHTANEVKYRSPLNFLPVSCAFSWMGSGGRCFLCVSDVWLHLWGYDESFQKASHRLVEKSLETKMLVSLNLSVQ